MATVLNRITKEYKKSVNTPNFPIEDWIINPDFSFVEGVDKLYWKITDDAVNEMTQAEKDVVDATNLEETKVQCKCQINMNTAELIKDNEDENGDIDISKGYVDSGRTLKDSIDAATTKAELDAIVDDR